MKPGAAFMVEGPFGDFKYLGAGDFFK